MKQRLGIAAALLGGPKLLICDEPTSALDPIGRREILDILQSVREQTTVLFSTHVLSDVEQICTEVALLDGGKIAMQGTVNDLKKQRRGEGVRVEVLQDTDADRLQCVFPSATRTSANCLTIEGEAQVLYDLLSYVGAHRIPVGKIERIEPTLESLFVEVVKK
jgi:ABC-2 type transport system ATP-binding protein